MNCEFHCEGCGVYVYAVNLDTPPQGLMCASCDHLSSFISDPEELVRLARRLGIFGWERKERLTDETVAEVPRS